MSEAQTILKLIEEADPRKWSELERLDARIHWYANKFEWAWDEEYTEADHINSIIENYEPDKYTRSRDALKWIRPKGWAVDLTIHSTGIDSVCEVHKIDNTGNPVVSFFSGHFETEELAELHCIIQAIAYERSQT